MEQCTADKKAAISSVASKCTAALPLRRGIACIAFFRPKQRFSALAQADFRPQNLHFCSLVRHSRDIVVPEIYSVLKWLHIATAAIAFGSNVTHLFWIIGANNDPVHRANILRLVKKIDDRLAVPCYAVMVICGVTMWLRHWPPSESWLIASAVLTAILSAAGISFGPFMHRWIRVAGNPSADAAMLVLLQRRLTRWWAGLILVVPGILYWMIWKPRLW